MNKNDTELLLTVFIGEIIVENIMENIVTNDISEIEHHINILELCNLPEIITSDDKELRFNKLYRIEPVDCGYNFVLAYS